MSSITNAVTAYSRQAIAGTTRQTAAEKGSVSKVAEQATVMACDAVEISAEARLKLVEEEAGSLMNPAKALKSGSDEHESFRDLMDKVKSQKGDITSRIEAALGKAGISLSALAKVKLEVDSSGKILAGGIEDKKTARAIEAALNREPSLATAIQEYQKDEKELSRQIKDYTGCTLYELTKTRQGNTSQRVREVVEEDGKYQFGADYYIGLGFLGSTLEFVSPDDVTALGFSGGIDFSGELDLMADPEGCIKDSLEEMRRSIEEAFAEINATLADGLGIDADGEGRDRFLSLKKVSITMDSSGGFSIEGRLSSDPRIHEKGLALLEEIVRDRLARTDDNSYNVNTFMAASQNLIDREQWGGSGSAWSGRGDGMVVAQLTGGTVRGIRVTERTNGSAAADNVAAALKKSLTGVTR